MERPADLPDYDSPPVNEVVLGIQFHRPPITGAHIGAYWLDLKERFPKVSEQIALDPHLENFGDPSPSALPFGFSLARPESRFWFTNSDGSELLQLQSDRCLFNWRSVKNGAAYPYFETIQKRFWDEFILWRSHLAGHGFDLRPNQWEVTYVNRIEMGEHTADLDRALSFIRDPLRTALGGASEAAHFSSQRVLLTPTNQPWARAYVVARMGVGMDGARRLNFELTARGPTADGNDEVIRALQLEARKWIVRAFDTLTSEDMHQAWGKRK